MKLLITESYNLIHKVPSQKLPPPAPALEEHGEAEDAAKKERTIPERLMDWGKEVIGVAPSEEKPKAKEDTESKRAK